MNGEKQNMSKLITINNCRIEDSRNTIVPELSWTFTEGQSWLVIGPNGGGKADFVNGLSGLLKIVPNRQDDSLYSNVFGQSCEVVSLERAARLIQEERENDESEYVEGGVDIGRTGRVFIAESVCGQIKRNQPLPEFAKTLDTNEVVKLCGIQKILDRGIKYMSTGEIRRTLLARALISGKKLLILSDPFAGLDIESRTILLQFFDKISKNQVEGDFESNESGTVHGIHIILGMERWHEIPQSITNVIEFKDKKVSFCGSRADYEKIVNEKEALAEKNRSAEKEDFTGALNATLNDTSVLRDSVNGTAEKDSENAEAQKLPLIEMHNVNVGWDDHRVLIDLNWILYKGEHWLVRGPNGSGKTTFLELITGDNRQVFCNDIKLFGNRRGSGETIWDIKKQLGIVSYRMHVEYRMLGSTTLLGVIVSGFRDSIGLYAEATDVEKSAAKKWLALGGFEGRETESFGSLSYGEQRAILILRSAVKSPKILILDEPCHGLDEQYRQKILDLMNLIGEKGETTMLHVTHDPSEVLECEHHILELCPGQTPMYKILTK